MRNFTFLSLSSAEEENEKIMKTDILCNLTTTTTTMMKTKVQQNKMLNTHTFSQ